MEKREGPILRSSLKKRSYITQQTGELTSQYDRDTAQSFTKRAKFSQQPVEDDFTQNDIYSRPRIFNERRSDSKSARQDIAADSTEVLFPPSATDTKSTIGIHSDFQVGEVNQRFQLNSNAPVTSLPEFTDSYAQSSPELQIFRPYENSRQSQMELDDIDSSEIPTIKDLIVSYLSLETQDTQQTVHNNLESLFSSLSYGEQFNLQIPDFKFLSTSAFQNLSNASRNIASNINIFSDTINEISQNLITDPPLSLRTLNTLHPDEVSQIISRSNSFISLFKTQAIIYILKQVLELEKSFSSQTQTIKNLRDSYNFGEEFLLNDPTIAKIEELQDIRRRIKEAVEANGDIHSRIQAFTQLRNSLCFAITSIKSGIATVVGPGKKPQMVSNISIIYNDVASSSRKSSLSLEIAKLAESIPNVSRFMLNGIDIVEMTFTRFSGDLRFSLQFAIDEKLYPWVTFCFGVNARLSVSIGNEEEIGGQISRIFSNIGFDKRPILKIAQRINNDYQLSYQNLG